MKEYVMTLIGASLLSGIVGTLCPKKHQKYLRLLCGLCVIAAMVTPLPSYLSDAEVSWLDGDLEYGAGTQDAYEEIYRQTLMAADAEAVGTYLETLLCSEFSIAEDAISVSVTVSREENRVALERVTVWLSGSGILKDPHAIAAYVEATLGCPCEIVYS